MRSPAVARGPRGRRWRLVRARRDPAPGSVRRRSQRPRLRVAAPWVAGGLAIVGLVWVVFFTSLLGVRDVRVSGSQIVGEERVRAVAGIVEGTPLARLDTDGVEQRIGALPSVAAVVVRRAWPHTIVVEITERVPAAVVARGQRFLVVDAEGVVFNTVTTRPVGVVLLRVDSPGPDDPATSAALRVLATLTPRLRSLASGLVAESASRIRLELSDGRVVVWGDAEQSETKAGVATSLLPRPGRTIDVSAPEVATVSG